MIPELMYEVKWLSSEDGRGSWTHSVLTENLEEAKRFAARHKSPYESVGVFAIRNGVREGYKLLDLNK
jgi:hypothetical protein